MPRQPKLVLHVTPFSHPCLAVSTALERYGLEHETVSLRSGPHGDEIEAIYGEGRRTVPAMLVDEEPVHGTSAIFERIDQLADEAELYPAEVADSVREAERGVSEELQAAGRHLVFGALHFRPEALGTFAGSGMLDPAGTDFSIRFVRGAWRYIGITAELVATDLERLPGLLDRADELVAEGVMGRERPTAADFQVVSSLRLLLQIGDLRPLLEGRPATSLVERWFDLPPGDIPAGAFPVGWTPELSRAPAA
jgi:glutathione S-transferase